MDSEAVYQWSLLTLLILVSLQMLASIAGIVFATLQIRWLRTSCSCRVLKRLPALLERTDETLARTLDATGNLSAWCEQVSAAADKATSTVVEVDAKIERSLSHLQETTTRWASQSDGLLERFSGATAQIHRVVLAPASRLAVLLQAVQTGLAHLKAEEEQEEDPSRYHADQEIFI